MSRRLLFSLFAALLLLCAGFSGAVRAAATVMTVVERAVDVAVPCCAPLPSDQGGAAVESAEALPAAEGGNVIELADLPPLPGGSDGMHFFHGRHVSPRPVLLAGHPAPWLAGLLRPPSRRA